MSDFGLVSIGLPAGFADLPTATRNWISFWAASRLDFSSSERSCRRSVCTDSAVASASSCRSAACKAFAHRAAYRVGHRRTAFGPRPTAAATASQEAPPARSSAALRNTDADGGGRVTGHRGDGGGG